MSLAYQRSEIHQFERIPVITFDNNLAASKAVAAEIASLIRHRAEVGLFAVLGLATGSTPTRLYAELVRLHKKEGLSFKNVITFNLDEYFPMQPDALQSYVRFMNEQLFDHVDIDRANVHIPNGTLQRDDVYDFCQEYERKIDEAGGIDIQILGIGRTGHIGFNEPGSTKDSKTRMVTLDILTRRDASGDFFGEENVPRRAITMGVGTIHKAKKVYLLAWGEGKAGIIRKTVEGPISDLVPATFLQEHADTVFVLDDAAASELTRIKTPWLVDSCMWDTYMTRRAVVWLCQKISKPILKLTDEDYNENGLGELVTEHGPSYSINIRVFNEMQRTITGWPGGKPNADDKNRPERREPFPKRVIIFSPHPDDDVISMGGTLCRLVDQGHEVHIAYEVSGAGAVPDEALWRMLAFAGGAGIGAGDAGQAWRASYERGSVPPVTEPVLAWKALIRRLEAISAAQVCGVPQDRLHFLDLPFYAAAPRLRRYGEADVGAMHALLESVRPHLIYAAGDLDDPHGTHRLCLRMLRDALARAGQAAWLREAELWLYRGAWAEWPLDEIDLVVPLSPQEVLRRRRAIFRHETQKDQALFLGEDRREFWQRTEDRGRRLAQAYNALGLAEYEAMEAFRRLSPEEFVRTAVI